MRNTNNHENEGNSIRMDRIMIVDHFQQGDGHDRPLRPIFRTRSGYFSIGRGIDLGNQRVRDRVTL